MKVCNWRGIGAGLWSVRSTFILNMADIELYLWARMIGLGAENEGIC